MSVVPESVYVPGAVDLRDVSPAGRPKGYVPYSPRGANIRAAERIISLYEAMGAADALPLGPRQVGYRLKELFPGEYEKSDFKRIEEIVKRLQQAGRLRWEWVSDASAVTYDPGGWSGPSAFLRDETDKFRLDLREGQPLVVEIFAEARETLPLIQRVAQERGVLVYSGGGSSGPNLARKVASRAVQRAVMLGQSTLILGICDFDPAGVRNVMRPHVEHVSAFVCGTAGNEYVQAVERDGELTTIEATDATASFKQLALTPTMALDLVEHDRDHGLIEDYIASGGDMWSRDLDLLEGVQKIETEALDPAELRDLVVAYIDAVIDATALDRLRADEELDKKMLLPRLLELADALEGVR